MTIPEQYKDRRVYHFTHISNLPGILEHGLLSTNAKKQLDLSHEAIAYTGIQDRRASMKVPCGEGGCVHDYVPLYFCKRSPMLQAVTWNKIADQHNLIYLEFPISIIEQFSCVFTDASANTNPSPNFYDNPTDLMKIDWEAVDTWRWGKQYDLQGRIPRRQAKMAELLVHEKLDISYLSQFVVWNLEAAQKLRRIFVQYKIQEPYVCFTQQARREYYYIDDRGQSPVIGPEEIYNTYKKTVISILPKLRIVPSRRFKNLYQLRDALRRDLRCLPETAELIDLQTGNTTHHEDVGRHTHTVVKHLVESPEYQKLTPTGQLLVEISAFLHDIGKGPKSRWDKFGGLQQADPNHTVNSLPMLERILTEEVAEIQNDSARIICKLVCYNDLIGDIIGKGRRIEELVKVANTEQELDLLVAIAKADIKSVNPLWLEHEKIAELKTAVEPKILASKFF